VKDMDVAIAEKMAELDEILKDNKYHSGWYSTEDVESMMHMRNSQARYWLNKGCQHGIFERRVANQGHGFYWWYEYKPA
jgi:predicted transcriptional regulator